MAIEHINVGASPNDKTGDTLRAAFQKVNANFDEFIGSGAEQGAAAIPAPVAGLSVADAALTINSIGELSSLPVPSLRPGRTVVVNVLGQNEEGDVPARAFRWQANSNQSPNGVTVFQPDGVVGPGRWVQVITGNKLYVEWGGAKAGYDPLNWVDSTAEVQAVINAAAGLGLEVDGVGTFVISGAISIAKDMKIVSNGTLKFKKPGVNTAGRIITSTLSGDAPDMGRVVIKGVSFEGDYNENQTADDGRQLVAIVSGEDVLIEDCSFYAGRHFGLVVNNARRVRILNNKADLMCRDAIASWGSDDVVIFGNTVTRSDDNGISAHVTSGGGKTRLRRSVKIVNNTLIDNAGPIQCVGGSDITISGNHVYRAKGLGIAVRQTTTTTGQPNSAMTSLIVDNNIIHDVLGTAWRVNGNPGETQSVSPYIIIGGPTENAPDWSLNPDGTYYAVQPTVSPMRNVKVRGNILLRTLPAVDAYSDWGFGPAFVAHSATDGEKFRDARVGDVDLDQIGIQINGAIWDGEISGNTIGTGLSSVNISATGSSAVDNLYRNVRIFNNTFLRASRASVEVMSDAPVKNYDIQVYDNVIDCDPYGENPNRGTSGTWQAATTPAAFRFVNVAGVGVYRNRIRNAARVVFGTAFSSNIFDSNVVVCNPVASGFSTGNGGVGEIPVNPFEFRPEIADCDPSSGNYGALIQATPIVSNALPSSGWFLRGWEVKNRLASIQGDPGSQYVVNGWKRLTTGSGHVLGTDWAEMRTPTGS